MAGLKSFIYFDQLGDLAQFPNPFINPQTGLSVKLNGPSSVADFILYPFFVL